jgi:hypothetical protein
MSKPLRAFLIGVLGALVTLLYAAAVVAAWLSLKGIPPELDTLRFVGAEALARERGFAMDSDARYSTETCLARAQPCTPDKNGHFLAEDIIRHAANQHIGGFRDGEMCSIFLLEPLFRSCTVIIIRQGIVRQGALMPIEVEKMLSAIRRPCRASLKSARQSLDCDGDRLRAQMKVLVYLGDKRESIVVE